MANTYQGASGWNNAGALADLAPQPASPKGVVYPQVVYDANGAASPKGYRTLELVWNVFEKRSDFSSIRTQLSLSDTVFSSEMTMRLPDNNGVFANWNCIVNWTQDFSRGFVFPSLNVTVVLVTAL